MCCCHPTPLLPSISVPISSSPPSISVYIRTTTHLPSPTHTGYTPSPTIRTHTHTGYTPALTNTHIQRLHTSPHQHTQATLHPLTNTTHTHTGYTPSPTHTYKGYTPTLTNTHRLHTSPHQHTHIGYTPPLTNTPHRLHNSPHQHTKATHTHLHTHTSTHTHLHTHIYTHTPTHTHLHTHTYTHTSTHTHHCFLSLLSHLLVFIRRQGYYHLQQQWHTFQKGAVWVGQLSVGSEAMGINLGLGTS